MTYVCHIVFSPRLICLTLNLTAGEHGDTDTRLGILRSAHFLLVPERVTVGQGYRFPIYDRVDCDESEDEEPDVELNSSLLEERDGMLVTFLVSLHTHFPMWRRKCHFDLMCRNAPVLSPYSTVLNWRTLIDAMFESGESQTDQGDGALAPHLVRTPVVVPSPPTDGVIGVVWVDLGSSDVCR